MSKGGVAGIPGAILVSMRPHQWTKNVFVFAALIFAQKLGDTPSLLKATAAFALFCVLSGTVYIINDLADREKDRTHPRKSKRPIAAGRLPAGVGAGTAVLLAAGALGASFVLGTKFGLAASAYFALNLIYSFALKQVVILDVMTIAGGFVLRAVAGAEAIQVPISQWLILCTTLLALFLGFCKRRGELTTLQGAASEHRTILREYSVGFLDQMISVVTASTVIAYAFYAMSPEVQDKLHTQYLGLTVPFVLYGIFRYLYLIHMRGEGDSPSRLLLQDRALLVNIVLWGLTCVVILYWQI